MVILKPGHRIQPDWLETETKSGGRTGGIQTSALSNSKSTLRPLGSAGHSINRTMKVNSNL